MSHLRERKEKDCLNCNAQVEGRYCHICGQENIEIRESVWHLISHFFKDITHFDGKFFSTLKYLIFKPGFVSKEYVKGRRASYLDPVRMYIFTSAVFFLIFFSVFKVNENDLTIDAKENGVAVETMDSLQFAKYTAGLNNGKPLSRDEFKKYTDSVTANAGIHFTGRRYRSKEEYDSLLASGVKKHNWLMRTIIYREIEVNRKYNNNQRKIFAAFGSHIQHSFPQMLFISLPLFALILHLMYARRKRYYYTNHLIFSVHLYIFVFIVFLIMIGINEVMEEVPWRIFSWITGSLFILLFFYEYKAMKYFYGQGTGKTLLKFLLLNLFHPIIIAILFVIFTFFSYLNI